MPERSRLKRANGAGDSADGGSSEDSMSEMSDVAEGDGFRISVDLSAYWGMPAACLVWVGRGRGRGRRVRGLARRVRAAAGLRRRFVLLAGARALPPAAPLRLLAPADQLSVVPVEHEWQRPFSFPASPSHSPSRIPGPTPTPDPVEPGPEPVAPLKKEKKRRREETVVVAPPLAADVVPGAREPEGDEALQRVKQRALALLERASGQEAARGGRGAGWDQPPLKKRRRRVRRRRKVIEPLAPEPIEPFEERYSIDIESSSVPEATELLVNPCEHEECPSPAKSDLSPAPPAPRAPTTPAPAPTTPAPAPPAPAPAPRAPTTPAPAPPAPAPAPRAPAPAPVVRTAVARAPRLVRALSGEALQKPMEEDPPPSPRAPAVTCN